MTQSLGSWGSPDSVKFHPFDFYGQTFHARGPSISVLRRMRTRMGEAQALVTDKTDELDAIAIYVGVLADYIGDCLTPAECDRWQKLIVDPDVYIELSNLRSLVTAVSELAGGADPLDSASSGPTPNGAMSEVGSVAMGYTTEPISPTTN